MVFGDSANFFFLFSNVFLLLEKLLWESGNFPLCNFVFDE